MNTEAQTEILREAVDFAGREPKPFTRDYEEMMLHGLMESYFNLLRRADGKDIISGFTISVQVKKK